MVKYLNILKIRRIERNRLFFYKFFNNIGNINYFYFFYQRVGNSNSKLFLINEISGFDIKNSLLNFLHINKIFKYNFLIYNQISVIFINKKFINNLYIFFTYFIELIQSFKIIYLGGIFTCWKDNNWKKNFINYKIFILLFKIFKIQKKFLFLQIFSIFFYNFLKCLKVIKEIWQIKFIKVFRIYLMQ